MRTGRKGVAGRRGSIFNVPCSMFNVYPATEQDTVLKIVNAVLCVLACVGEMVGQAAQGIADSARAMGHQEPLDVNEDLNSGQS